jgi:hypothetical protein
LKISKIIGLFITIIQLVSTLALIISLHTIFQSSDRVVMPFLLMPVNDGFLEATMEVNLSILVNGENIASDNAIVTVPPDSMAQIELELIIPLRVAQEYFVGGSDIQWRTDITIKTLNDLISLNNQLVIEGGGQ